MATSSTPTTASVVNTIWNDHVLHLAEHGEDMKRKSGIAASSGRNAMSTPNATSTSNDVLALPILPESANPVSRHATELYDDDDPMKRDVFNVEMLNDVVTVASPTNETP